MARAKHHFGKAAVFLIVGVLLGLTLLVVQVIRQETKDYPGVTVSGEPILKSPRTVEQGGELLFMRDSVCVPGGRTTVKRWAQADPFTYKGVTLTNSFDLGQFTLDATGPVCFAPSETLILLPTNIVPGKYVIRLEATVVTPNDVVTNTSYSPPFRVVKAEPMFTAEERAVAREAIKDFLASQKD